jgi:hypothetical protein
MRSSSENGVRNFKRAAFGYHVQYVFEKILEYVSVGHQDSGVGSWI